LLQVPRPVTGLGISITYQAKPEPLSLDNPSLLDVEIVIPTVLEEAVLSYISYKVFSEINTQEANVKSQEHFTIFSELCKEAVDFDLVNTSISTTNTRFHRNGWI